MRQMTTAVMLFAAAVSCGVPADGTDWPNWRGPFANGSSDAVGLPEVLSKETTAWSVSLPGPAGSTPILVNGRLFMTSTEKETDNLVGLCIDAADGTVLWKKTLSVSTEQFPRNTLASPSPTADARCVYFQFGNGQIICCDHDGKVLWRRDLAAEYGPLSLKFGYSSSPLLANDTLYIPVLRRQTTYHDPQAEKPLMSYLIALNTGSGKTVFYHERLTDAVDETTNSYITPVAAQVDGALHIVLFGADYLTAHDPKTGRETLRYQYDNSKYDHGRNIPTPIADGAMLYAVYPRAGSAAAFDLTDGKTSLRWKADAEGSDASSPALYKGCLYVVEDRTKMLVCVDAASGRVRWKGQLDKKAMYFSAVTAADDKLYTVNEAGVVNVIAADPSGFRLLSTTDFQQRPVYSSIVAVKGRLFLRTADTLYCFEQPKP